jgi:serine/threonine-protein kinase RsbW
MTATHFLAITAVLDDLSEIRHFIEESARSLGAGASTISDLRIAVDEAVSNVCIHGYGGKGGYIELEVDCQGGDLIVRLRDKAKTFDPTTLPVPTLHYSLKGPLPGGVGVHLIRQAVDEVRYRSAIGGGNELILVKRGILSSG